MDILSTLFQQQSRKIGMIVPSVVVSEKHSDTLEITEHPVEVGAAVADHAYKKPSEVVMEVGFAGGGALLDFASNLTATSLLGLIPRQTYQEILDLQASRIARKGATNSTVDLLLTGTAGTTITNGTVKDTNNVIWRLPASVVIGVDGTVTATATCSNSGAVAALAGTITTINTPTRGWTSVTNPAVATVGAPAETDAELRIRQGQSVALPPITPFEGVDGAIANVPGVTRHKLYENDTGATDSNGLPPHSISAIVDGGDVTEIAQTIRGNKGQGTATYGTTSVTVPDTYGNPHVISFSRSTDVPIYGHITLKAFTGYTSQIGVQIQQAVADYINGLTIGDDVLLSRIYSPANFGVVSGGNARYYDIQELLIGKSAGSVAAANIIIAYNESASCKPENIILTVTS